MSSESFLPPGARTRTEVFAVHGADPEILAFAMAKYSRSSLSMRESLSEISSQRAGQFLNTFYFQYGHRSIADLAHIAFAVERLSLLAAMVLLDETRWDGQERSTRYQNFLESGWFFPGFGEDSASAELYSKTIENLFATYQRVSAAVFDLLRSRVARPETLKPEVYERTLRARAFDVARYLLPLATNTSLGQIVSARTLETQVSRLLSHPAAEVRMLGEKLREAATGPAWNLNAKAAQAFIDKLAEAEEQGSGFRGQGSEDAASKGQESDPAEVSAGEAVKGHDFSRAVSAEKNDGALAPAQKVDALKGHEFTRAVNAEKNDGALAPAGSFSSLAAEAAALFTREVRTAPTLVKYAQPNPYLIETQAELAQAATEILKNHPIAAAPLVDLVERTESLEVELAATLLYSASHHPYRQIRDLVSSFPSARVDEIIELGLKHRGRHDEALRAFHSGAALRFDLFMDIGGFRDMHRHRRCTQIIQGFTAQHGYETPGAADLPAGPQNDFDILAAAGVLDDYRSAIESAHLAAARIAAGPAPEASQSAQYLLPLATRIRALFKMDFAEAQYITELRSAPAGHFSYRRVAWEMFLALQRQHPSLAKHIRVTDFTQPIDLFQR
jgi:thymidylate synthase ThyX